MKRLKSNSCLIISLVVLLFIGFGCKQEKKKTGLNTVKQDELNEINTKSPIVSVDDEKQSSKVVPEVKEATVEPDFDYTDLIGRTFLPVGLHDGEYHYGGDITKEDDMLEQRIRFKEKCFRYLIPIEWQIFYITEISNKDKWLKLNVVGDLEFIDREDCNFQFYFKYDKAKKLLFYSRDTESNHLEVFQDSAFIALKESKKPKQKKENPHAKYLIYKTNKIIIDSTEVEIKIPFIKEHLNEYGNKIFGESQISDHLMVKLLKGKNGDLFSVFGEGKCGACPNFLAYYSIDGKLLCYAYAVRMSVYESKTLLEKGNFEDIMLNYGITNKDENIQINNSNTPSYTIRDWY